MILQISNTSIDLNFLPSLCLKTEQIFSIPSTKIEGPLALPPNPSIFSPAPRIKIVLYEKLYLFESKPLINDEEV